MENRTKIKKLKISEILRESINLYKDNFKLLFTTNAIGVLILFFSDKFMNINDFTDIQILNVLISFVGVILAYVGLYYSIKITVTLSLTIMDRYNNKKVTIKESYDRSKEYIWKYIGTLFLLSLMLILPIVFMLFSNLRIESLILKAIVFLVGAIVLIYILLNYGLALYVRLFKPEISAYFKYSKKIVNKHFGEVFCILLIILIVQLPSYIPRLIIDGSTLGVVEKLIYNNMGYLIRLVAYPFTTGMMIITFVKLDRG